MESPILTIKEAAELLKVSPTTLRRFSRTGMIPCFKVGATWRFNRQSILDWSASQETYYLSVKKTDKLEDPELEKTT